MGEATHSPRRERDRVPLTAMAPIPARGLSVAEATQRLREHGANELSRAKGTAAWRMMLGQLVSTLLTGLTQSREQADHICRFCDEDACPARRCPVECKAISIAGAQ